MSAPLTTVVLSAADRDHTLKRARLDETSITTDLQQFRAPFGSRWHKLGTGHAVPELLMLSGAVEGVTKALTDAALELLLADLPLIDTLGLGAWSIAVAGTVGPVSITPTLAGWRVQLALVRADGGTHVP